MHALSKLTLGLTALLCASTAADAQTYHWDRRVNDVRIVHPPGTPPGTWRVEATIGVFYDGSFPGIDLGFDTTLSVNGIPIQTIHTDCTPPPALNNCNAACNSSCTYLLFNTIPIDGTCAGSAQICGCWNVWPQVFTPMTAGALDTVRVEVTAVVQHDDDFIDQWIDLVVGEHNPGTPTCAGDGSNPVACPCANNGASGHGCGNSSNSSGAKLSATGFVEADMLTGNDSVVLHVTGMTVGAPLLYFQGTSNAITIPFGDGTLCTTGSIIRLRVKINVGGASQFPEPGDPSVSVTGGVTPGSGATRYYQAYYRDSASYCTSATFNMTNGISLTWY